MVIREGGVVEQCAHVKYLKGKILQKYPHLKYESSNMCINTLECLNPQFTT